MLKLEDFAKITVHMVSVLLKGVMQVLAVVVSAVSIVPNQSALGNGAPRPSNQRVGVTYTAMAKHNCARCKAALRLLQHVVSARSMVRLESASLQVAPLGWYLLKNRIATDTAETR